MSEIPIRRLAVADFRRLEGKRELPFDAPVVLIHGPNGTGKTSVLSALELALTGGIRSMARHSEHYRAHLPFFGQSYATVRADVAENLQVGTPGVPLTVSRTNLEGTPAFSDEAAKFYAERCYLDQASLGRLLDLYQAREGNEQSALEKFVSELLGLEKIDALRGGLNEANDLRLLKKLAVGVYEADREAKAAAAQFKEQSALHAEILTEAANARSATREAMAGLHPGTSDDMSDTDILELIKSVLNDDTIHDESEAALTLHQKLIALGGRISALIDRSTTQQIQETRTALAVATADEASWETTDGEKVLAWEATAYSAGVNLRSDPRLDIQHATRQALQFLQSAAEVQAQTESHNAQLEVDRADLEILQSRISDAHEHSSVLVESLAALRSVIEASNNCPVCDRDFTETGHHSLLTHIDTKLAELTIHGQQLVDLRYERDQLAAKVTLADAEYTRLKSGILSAEEYQAAELRYATLVDLTDQVGEIEAIKSKGEILTRKVRNLQQLLGSLESASSEERYVRNELARYADLLQVNTSFVVDSLDTALTELLERSEARLSRLTDKINQHRKAGIEAERMAGAIERESASAKNLDDIEECKTKWDARLTEAKRRQGVAKEVHEAATQARTAIVHRVFTESLNEIWKTVFTRLAPNEGFVPSFGIPSSTKKNLDIKLETTHLSGEASGPPQMMLSAGNLNTAALSLFLALHLAVEPIVPCLVLDDPVQAMDEVHISQFAALIRLISKQNNRQVILAVHERELFDYLALELSPAFDGDELITIELGERATEEDEGITRHVWKPDAAIAS
ncbi:AAA family ATPase [Glutamicibacter sp. NPDC087344]|uniref:AAA family ATPase n=1 Tax=Glutamicibacter sp. NPDC087344 TaxID=3363994 RepID=UPI0038146D4C